MLIRQWAVVISLVMVIYGQLSSKISAIYAPYSNLERWWCSTRNFFKYYFGTLDAQSQSEIAASRANPFASSPALNNGSLLGQVHESSSLLLESAQEVTHHQCCAILAAAVLGSQADHKQRDQLIDGTFPHYDELKRSIGVFVNTLKLSERDDASIATEIGRSRAMIDSHIAFRKKTGSGSSSGDGGATPVPIPAPAPAIASVNAPRAVGGPVS